MKIGKHSTSVFSSDRIGEYLALASLALCVVSELLFRYSVLPQTYPGIGEAQVLVICNSVVAACAIVAIATKTRAVAIWQGLLVAIVLAPLLFSASRTGDYRLVFGALIVIAVAGLDLRRICAVFAASLAGTVVVMTLLTLAGVMHGPDAVLTRDLAVKIGFADHNTFGAVLFSGVAALGIVLRGKRSWPVPLVLAVVGALFSYVLLGSRGAAIALALLAVALLLGNIKAMSRLWDIPQKVYFGILIAVPLVIMLAILGAVAFYGEGNAFASALDSLLGGRIAHAHDYFAANGGFTHLGRKLAAGGNLVDSGYLYLSLVTGMLSMYALMAVYGIAAWRRSRTDRDILVLAVLVIASIYLAIDLSPLFLAQSVAFLLLAPAFEPAGEPEGAILQDKVPAPAAAKPQDSPEPAADSEPLSVPAPKKRSKSDIAIYVLSGVLLVTLGAAALYGWHYGNVDESVTPGHIDVYENGSLLLTVNIEDDMTAKVGYLRRVMTGKFVLAGAEEDTILYQLKNIKFADGADASDTVFFLRIPRSGLQGDFSGPWMTYFSCPSQSAKHSDWIIANGDGTASVGGRDKMNAITAQRKQLLEWSKAWTWKKSGYGLYLTER